MSRLVIVALRAILVVITLGTLALQVVFILGAAGLLDGAEPLPVPYAVIGVAALASAQAGLLALWVLLAMVRCDAIFDERAFRWVRVLPAAGLAAAVLVGALCVHVGELDDAPGLVVIGGGIGLSGVAFALLMVVMHGLLRSATLLRHELEEVV
ncbi:DUF2975 domain-containing protein [Pseudonocardia nantongensis]|uniref:DUF2975 domain-containing protein n=1 Tax=Pseudonocardia nantongensis TaxID=1181885 RepID=UPI00397AA000